jgi:hypothetical protein
VHAPSSIAANTLTSRRVDVCDQRTARDETGAARLQQLGLFLLIFVLEENGTPVTTARLAAISRQKVSAVQKRLLMLEDADVIERAQLVCHLQRLGMPARRALECTKIVLRDRDGLNASRHPVRSALHTRVTSRPASCPK